MPGIFPIQTHFSAGEISPKARGRVDSPLFKAGLATCKNFIPTPQGSLISRPGSRYAGFENLTVDEGIRLIPFKSKRAGDFMVTLKAASLSVRSSAGELQPSGTERLTNPRFDPVAGGMLTGWTATNALWRANTDIQDGGMVSIRGWYWQNGAPTEVRQSVSVPAGTYTIRASLLAGGGESPDVITLKAGTTLHGSELGSMAFPSIGGDIKFDFSVGGTTTVYIEVARPTSAAVYNQAWAALTEVSLQEFTSTGLTTPWVEGELDGVRYVQETAKDRMILVHPRYEPQILSRSSAGNWTLTAMTAASGYAAWNGGTAWGFTGSNWPSVVEVFQGRLYLAATPDKPNTFWASKPGALLDFTSGLTAGDAFSYDIATKGKIVWMRAQKVMLVGTDGEEYSITASDGVVYIGNIDIRMESSYGSCGIDAKSLGDQVIFVSGDRRKVRSLAFSLEGNGWFSQDLTMPSEHITKPVISDMVFLRDPYNTIALLLSDGTMACGNYDKSGGLIGWWRLTAKGRVIRAVAGVDGPLGSDLWAITSGGIDSAYYDINVVERFPMYETGDAIDLGGTPGAVVYQRHGYGAPPPSAWCFPVGSGLIAGLYMSLCLDGVWYDNLDTDTGTTTNPVVIVSPVGDFTPVRFARYGRQIELEAETLPLEGGNPAGSAQGFKVHRADLVVRLNESGLPLLDGQVAEPGRTIGESLPEPMTPVTVDATAKGIGYIDGGIVTITQPLPTRTEICALYGGLQMNKV